MGYSTTQYLDSVKIFKMLQYASKCNFSYIHMKGMAFPGLQMFQHHCVHQTATKSDDKCAKYA
jgi:hypothetical protein